MNMRSFIVFFSAVSCLLAQAADLRVSVRNPGTEPVKIPVTITGRQFLAAENGKPVDRAMIRVFGKSGAEYVCQVDCRTESGSYIPRKDTQLAPFDEIVFVADTAKDREYRITQGKNPAVHTDTITMKRAANPYFDAVAENTKGVSILIKSSGAKTQDEEKLLETEEKEWTVAETGVNALPLEMLIESKPQAKKEKPQKVVHGDFAKGGMSIVRDKVCMTAGLSWDMETSPAQPFGRLLQDAPWSMPVTVANGPVRRIIRTTYVESDAKDLVSGGVYTRKGLFGKLAVENLFTLYNESGVVDYEERVLYEKLDQYALLFYTLAITSGSQDIKQELIMPDELKKDTAYILPMSRLAEYYKDLDPETAGTVLFFRNPVHQKPLDGYIGIRNPETKRGIAVFYETPRDFQREFTFNLRLRLGHLHNGKVNTLIPVVTQEFFEGGYKHNGRLSVKFRYFLFDEPAETSVVSAYRMWNDPEKYITVNP